METDKEAAMTNVILDVSTDAENQYKPEKSSKRVLHFCDGDLVECSDEDETDAPLESDPPKKTIDPKSLSWVPWTWYQTVWIGSKVLNGADYMGEALADFFGITSPKYQFEIEEFKRLEKIHDEEKRKEDLEMERWNHKPNDELIVNDIRSFS